MREQNDLTKTLKGNNSQISTRVRVHSLYVCKKKKVVEKEVKLTFTHLPQAERIRKNIISIVMKFLFYLCDS